MSANPKLVGIGVALALCLFSAAIAAAPVAHFSRTSVLFGGVLPSFTSSTQPIFITNTGDAPLAISALTVTGPKSTYFLVAGTCGPPVSLSPGQRCRVDVVFKPTAFTLPFGISEATLTVQSNAVSPSTLISLSGDTDRLGFGLEATYTPNPEWLDFDAQGVGTPAVAQTLSIQNETTFPFDIEQFALIGGDRDDFAMVADCAVGEKFAANRTCRATVTFTPLATGLRSTELSFKTSTFDGEWTNRYSITGIGGNTGPAQAVTVVEYYNPSLGHYFITHVAAEQANLDAGNTPTRWTRTGGTFKAYLAPQAGSSPVCRYYIPPDKGDSHFFGRGTAECNATGAANPTFVLEAPEFMHLYLPVAGACPAGTTTIYRVFSNRADANHRYMTDRATRDQMVGQGWLAEGDGPDLVVMCGAS